VIANESPVPLLNITGLDTAKSATYARLPAGGRYSENPCHEISRNHAVRRDQLRAYEPRGRGFESLRARHESNT